MGEGAIFPVAGGMPKSLRGTNIPREFGMGGAKFSGVPDSL